MIKHREVQILHALLLTGSVSGTSKLLNVSQPAVSKALAALEKRIGFQLFQRTAGQLVAKPEAMYLFEELDQCLKIIERLDERIKSAEGGLGDRLQIASLPGPASFLIPQLLKEFFGAETAHRFLLSSRTTPIIRDLVSTQQVEIGVLVNPPLSTAYEKFPTPNEYVCGMREDHPLSSKTLLRPVDLEGVPLTLTSRGHIMHEQLAAAFTNDRVQFNPAHEVPYYIPSLGFALAGFGVSFVDTITAWSFENILKAKGLVFRRFEPQLIDEMAVISPSLRTLPTAAVMFRDFLVERMSSMKSLF